MMMMMTMMVTMMMNDDDDDDDDDVTKGLFPLLLAFVVQSFQHPTRPHGLSTIEMSRNKLATTVLF